MAGEELKVEKRYWMRVWIVAVGIATGWRHLPEWWDEERDDIVRGLLAVWWLLAKLVLPLFFWLAPLWLYLLERANRRREDARAAAVAEFDAQHGKLRQRAE